MSRASTILLSIIMLVMLSGLWSSNLTDHFRSNGSGDWNSPTTWTSSVNGTSSWVVANLTPSNLAASVTVQLGHTVHLQSPQLAHNLTVMGKLQFETNGVASYGLLTNTGTINFGPQSEVIYNMTDLVNDVGLGLFGIPVLPYQNLTINASTVNTAVMLGHLYVNGSLKVNGGGKFDTGLFSVYGEGNLDIQEGASLIIRSDLGMNGLNHTTGGDSFFSSGANYEFRGLETGTFITTPALNTVGDLTFNAANINLSQSFVSTGLLTIQCEKLFLGNNDLTATVMNAGSTPNIYYNGLGVCNNINTANLFVTVNAPTSLPLRTNSLHVMSDLALEADHVTKYLEISADESLTLNDFMINISDYSLGFSGNSTITALNYFRYNQGAGQGLKDITSIDRKWLIEGDATPGLEATVDWPVDADNGLDFYNGALDKFEGEVMKFNGTNWVSVGIYEVTTPSASDPKSVTFPIALNTKDSMNEYTVKQPESTLPVELSAFTGYYASDTGISLSWTTESESNLLGYNIYRNSVAELDDALMINPKLIMGTNTSNEHIYTYTDGENLEIETEYCYWIQSREYDGNTMFFGPVKVKTSGSPVEPDDINLKTGIKAVYPNPFNPNTTVSFDLAVNLKADISVYNVKGQLIKELYKGELTAGNHKVSWNGTDYMGNECASGVYCVRLKAGKHTTMEKIMLLK